MIGCMFQVYMEHSPLLGLLSRVWLSLDIPLTLGSSHRYVRKHIGSAMRLRLTPEIRFLHDDTAERAERVKIAPPVFLETSFPSYINL